MQKNIYWELFRVAIAVKHHLMDLAEMHGLSVMQLYTLCLLESSSSLPMNSLSSMLYCDASNVTGIVDRLLHQSYIKREENPKDRREKMVMLTPQGIALCEQISKVFPQRLQALSSVEQRQLKTILVKLLPVL